MLQWHVVPLSTFQQLCPVVVFFSRFVLSIFHLFLLCSLAFNISHIWFHFYFISATNTLANSKKKKKTLGSIFCIKYCFTILNETEISADSFASSVCSQPPNVLPSPFAPVYADHVNCSIIKVVDSFLFIRSWRFFLFYFRQHSFFHKNVWKLNFFVLFTFGIAICSLGLNSTNNGLANMKSEYISRWRWQPTQRTKLHRHEEKKNHPKHPSTRLLNK